jgi:GSH-dependent disulfide-bond oxidoreductase
MIEVFFAPTPNCWKTTILLEELDVPYRTTSVDLGEGGQFEPDFLAISPNNRVPAIIDHAPLQGEPMPIFESGAILLYLAEKHGRFLPGDPAGRFTCIEWLMWQISALGPMLGQHGHFRLYAEEQHPYALDRFRREAERLYAVLDRRLDMTGQFLTGDDYTIADIACFPWVMTHKAQGFDLANYPGVKRWFAELRARPGLQRGLVGLRDFRVATKNIAPEKRQRFFGAKE